MSFCIIPLSVVILLLWGCLGTQNTSEGLGAKQPRTRSPKGHHQAFPSGSCRFPWAASWINTQTLLQAVMPTSLLFLVWGNFFSYCFQRLSNLPAQNGTLRRKLKRAVTEWDRGLFMASVFTIAKKQTQPKCPLTDKWVKKTSYII